MFAPSMWNSQPRIFLNKSHISQHHPAPSPKNHLLRHNITTAEFPKSSLCLISSLLKRKQELYHIFRGSIFQTEHTWVTAHLFLAFSDTEGNKNARHHPCCRGVWDSSSLSLDSFVPGMGIKQAHAQINLSSCSFGAGKKVKLCQNFGLGCVSLLSVTSWQYLTCNGYRAFIFFNISFMAFDVYSKSSHERLTSDCSVFPQVNNGALLLQGMLPQGIKFFQVYSVGEAAGDANESHVILITLKQE